MAASMALVTIPLLSGHSGTACPNGESLLSLVVAEQQREIGANNLQKTSLSVIWMLCGEDVFG